MSDHEHVRCARCGECTHKACREARRRGPWVAPRGGGYHGCVPMTANPMPPGPPPRNPASATKART